MSEDSEFKQIVRIERTSRVYHQDKVHFEVEIFSENVVITHQYTRCQNRDQVFVNIKISNFFVEKHVDQRAK